MATYQGHRSWNAWNVALWIANDEPTYRAAIRAIDAARRHARSGTTPDRIASDAARRFSLDCIPYGEHTPDGAIYNRKCVKEAIKGLMEEY